MPLNAHECLLATYIIYLQDSLLLEAKNSVLKLRELKKVIDNLNEFNLIELILNVS